MTSYGLKLNTKVKAPRLTPPYHTEDQIESLVETTKNKKTHKKNAIRDTLLIELATTTGMRRSELAGIRVGDIDFENFRTAKGERYCSTTLSVYVLPQRGDNGYLYLRLGHKDK